MSIVSAYFGGSECFGGMHSVGGISSFGLRFFGRVVPAPDPRFVVPCGFPPVPAGQMLDHAYQVFARLNLHFRDRDVWEFAFNQEKITRDLRKSHGETES